MNPKHSKASAQAVLKDIRRATRKQYSAEEKIRIAQICFCLNGSLGSILAPKFHGTRLCAAGSNCD